MAAITSVRHPLVQRLRGLRDAAGRAAGEFPVEGRKLVAEALASGADVTDVLVSPRLDETPAGRALLKQLAAAKVEPRQASDRVLGAAVEAETHQGVVAVARRREATLAQLLERGSGTVLLVAHEVRDPGNLGALTRVAEALGATGLIACGSADPWGPKAVRASAGSIFRLPVVRVAGLEPVVEAVVAAGFTVAAAHAQGGGDPGAVLRARPLAILLGSEAHGLPEGPALKGATPITIALASTVESLNVVAAAAILLHGARGGDARVHRGF